MFTALLALDYPADRLTLVVVDDGSDDTTGARLDARGAPALDPDTGDGRAGAHAPSERLQIADHRVREPTRAALGARPAGMVAHHVQVGRRDRAARPMRGDLAVHRRAEQPRLRA